MTEKVKIRSLLQDDIQEVRDLISEAGPFVSARTLSDYWLYSRFFSETCLVAEISGEIAGVVVAVLNQVTNSGDCYIQDVAVSSKFRGTGVGKVLMEHLELAVREHGYNKMWLTSEAANSNAIALWRRLGFVNSPADYQENDLWVTRDLKGKGKDRVVFEKSLK
ncbi:GNAT family N-acetyltransferase [Pseudorhodobacter sp. E13]|uniref:GNAT family N-acetyltransferase n=1 Tax=Pseudorhodobacter sp. E13 TaxID=2487931 RepID=UPI000F8D3DD6|nr:GNAT family N-acetyltransferase [Pseudorhodobacter sp. E13]RUS63647.1 GNAT family N-acetyltransferase [Pseudorhodobacter sp. E13]